MSDRTMEEVVLERAQQLWREDPNATQPSWGFVTMKDRGEYMHQVRQELAEYDAAIREDIQQIIDGYGK